MKRILVIEDDRDNAAVLGMRLRSEGYDVAVAYDAVSGLSTATRFQPNLVLLDISMPGGGGLLVAQRLRNMVGTVAVPIIFVTGVKDPELRAKATSLGASGFFEKPYDQKNLLGSIARLLGETVKSAASRSRAADAGVCASEPRRVRPRGRAGRE
jgi:two-component system alkaline phosphatase synthesis response regulator PhoP